MNVFLDSSALVKRYVTEPGSDDLEAILANASGIGVSVLCPLEIVSALCRRRRERQLNRPQYERAKSALFADIADASVINVTGAVIARAVQILQRWPLRSMDSVHIASASSWSADLFVSADGRQCVAARGYGLRVQELPVG